MWKKTPLLLLGVMLLAQFAYSAPAKDSSSSSEEDEKVTPRDMLLLQLIGGFFEVIDFTMDEELKLAKKLYDDEKIKNSNTEIMEKFKQNLTKVISGVEEIHKLGKGEKEKDELITHILELTGKAFVMSDFDELMSWHDPEKVADPTKEDFIIEKALVRVGAEKVDAEVEKKFIEFSDSFIKEIGEYFDKLSAAEKVKEQKMSDWFTEYKAEKDSEKKANLLLKFLTFYGIDLDSKESR